MKQHRLWFSVFALFTAVLPVLPQAGGTGMTFLTLGVGSRSLGMGEAYTAASNDPASAIYNPATLTSVDATTISFMHRTWVKNTSAQYLAGAFDLGAVSLGFSVYSVSTDEIPVRDTPGPALTTFTARNAALGLTLGYTISQELSVGLTTKYLYEKILADDAGGTALDLGAVYTTAFGARIGASVLNLGSMSELGSESTTLPKLFRGGVSYGAAMTGPLSRLTGAVDFVSPLGDGTSRLRLGGEALLYDAISLRAGFQPGYETRGFTAGTGIRQGIVSVDYAFMPDDLGSTHAITLSLQLR